jgi:GDP-L-fucose synthase
MKILVTGATGFLGARLCSRLLAEGNSVVGLGSRQCDLTKQGALDLALVGRDGEFDNIYHLAAWTQAGDFCLHHQGEQWAINQQINTNVLEYWREKQPRAKLVAMGTSCSYDPALELKEENYLSGKPIDSLFTYAMTKRMLYSGMLAFNRQFGLKYMCFVPSTLYGPGYHTDGRQMHFIFDLIRKIIRGKIYGEPVVLWGDGNQKRELVHIDDFIGIMLRLNGKVENDIVNIGAGKEHAIRHFVKLICDKVGYEFGKVEFDTSRYVGAKSKCLDVTKLKSMLPDYELTPLEAGLSDTIDWFWHERDRIFSKDPAK